MGTEDTEEPMGTEDTEELMGMSLWEVFALSLPWEEVR